MADVFSPGNYGMMNSTAFGNDLTYFFVYCNDVTNGLFMTFFIFGFFFVVFISSLIYQQRFTSRIRPESSFLASSFVTFLLCIILSQVNGLTPSFTIFGLVTGMLLIGIIWIVMSSNE